MARIKEHVLCDKVDEYSVLLLSSSRSSPVPLQVTVLMQ